MRAHMPGLMTSTDLSPPSARPFAVSNWLLALCGLIFVMVVVGGITRLTESGLSITEWKPITGAIPPLTEAQWLREFDLYKRIPEYQQINKGMSLEDFKNIFFWEWAHRQLGRVIGLAALLPLAWFAFRKAIPQGYGWRTGSIFLLVCVQGAIGWWMVASGLTERTDVSHVRLAVHLLMALFIFGFALWTDPLLTLVGVCGMPPVIIVLTKIGMKMRKSARRSLEKISTMASVVNETVNGISIVKVFTMERYEIERVRTEITRLRRFLLQMVRLHATTGPVTEFILVLGVTVFLLYAAKRMETGELKLGELTTLLIALAMLLDPLRKMSAVNNMIQTSIASAERVFEFIDMTPEIDEREGAPALSPMERGIRFDNVTFGYSSEVPVLHNFSLEVRKGETVALVGPSGSGKSTIIKLIPRFYDIQGGAILIDGQNISDVSAHSLREQISLVTQNTILFAETIRENIAAGQSHYTQEDIERAATAAHAVEFIEKLPKGYDTRLDEAGTTLSGGQRQRLAIARAFIKDPSILILDEATSSLDSESERLIQDALDHFLDGRTAFIIAHRLSTIQRADRILFIQEGRIVEEGSHTELLARNGAYARLYRTQFDTQEPPA